MKPDRPRHRTSFRFAACLLLAASSTVMAGGDDFLLAPTASVAGRSQSEWSRDWWEWATSFPAASSPIADRTGERCGAGQSGPVWFLAGAFGSALVQRTCIVPPGKHLFFPMVNYVVFPNGNRTFTCEQATALAKKMTDDPEILVAAIDGARISDLERHRQATRECFDLAARSGAPMPIAPAAANGYYLMLSPLPPGRHTLRFGGDLTSIRQAISYDLVVE